ncbi:SRP40, C-terminal domain-containing protein [Macrophomina phaseolina]|nr:SRP40, C-terminal domain-containing protein [Macrophomina phaseolina]
MSTPSGDAGNKRAKKTNEPFSRIPKDIKVDPKFASNAYVPYDYAQRAHEKLIVTKGKGFTKEKNKGKRGSYRGGLIDTNKVNGIKFDD